MKRLLAGALGTLLLASTASAATMTIASRYGESLATWLRTDNHDDDDDGIYFLDRYLATDNSTGVFGNKHSFSHIQFEAEGAGGGVQFQLKYYQKAMTINLLNGWINMPLFGNTLRVTVGRFDAYPAVDFVKDATVGFHYNSYAAQYQAGFDPQVMSWFLRQQGFLHGTHPNISAAGSGWTNAVGTTLEGYDWYFYDPNNAGARINYDNSYYGVTGGLMASYLIGENLFFRIAAVEGSAETASSALNNYYGRRTLTNLNFQASLQLPDIAKIGLTFKLSDQLSGAYNEGSGILKSAGSDISVGLAASSDRLADGLELYAGYTFGATYLGMEGDITKNGVTKSYKETYLLNAADLRLVYTLDERIKLGLTGNVSALTQSEYAKELGSNNGKYQDNLLGFSVGLSGSYQFIDSLAFDLTAGFRCVDVNYKNNVNDNDMLAVSSVGIEPGVVFALAKNASLNIGLNFLLQNLSSNGDDAAAYIWLNNNKNSENTYQVFPFTMVVSLPLYFYIQL